MTIVFGGGGLSHTIFALGFSLGVFIIGALVVEVLSRIGPYLKMRRGVPTSAGAGPSLQDEDHGNTSQEPYSVGITRSPRVAPPESGAISSLVTRVPRRTVWFPKDLPLAIVVYVVIWMVGCGVIWLSIGNVLFGGGLICAIPGMTWGLGCGFIFSIYVAIVFREVWATVPVKDATRITDYLCEAAKPLRYDVEENPPSVFLCRPRLWLSRRFECNTVQVQMHDGFVELTGPAVIVNRFAKGLAAAASAPR
jgi:hypothetical protein